MRSSAVTIGWVSALPKLAPAPQIAALTSYGVAATDILIDGGKLPSGARATWDWLLRKVRPGDTLAVVKLRALYVPHGKLSPRKSLFRRMHQIEDAGCEIVEISTGRRSANQRERDMMIAECLDAIARSRTGGDSGRPKREPYSADELALVDQHWPSNRHSTNQAAVAAIHDAARKRGLVRLLELRSPQAFINVFGASGRGRLKAKR